MSAPKIISFVLWAMTGGVTAAVIWAGNTASIATVPHITEVPMVTYSQDDFSYLLQASRHATGAMSSAQVSEVNVRLLGIVFSSDARQSRVLVQQAQQPRQSLGVGDTLPNGGEITAIASRDITFSLNGNSQKMTLPRP